MSSWRSPAPRPTCRCTASTLTSRYSSRSASFPPKPDGPVWTLSFGRGFGLVTFLILEDQRRVDLLQVIWLD